MGMSEMGEGSRGGKGEGIMEAEKEGWKEGKRG